MAQQIKVGERRKQRGARRRRRRRIRRRCIGAGIVALLGLFGILFIKQIIDRGQNSTFGQSDLSMEDLQKTDTWNEIFSHQEDYPETMLEALEKNPEIQDFVKNYPDAEPVAQGGIREEEREEGRPLFLQWDARWGYVPYGDDNIGLSGCGPTCLSMVIFGLTGNENATPDAIANYSTEMGYYEEGAGTSWSLMTAVVDEYDVTVEELPLDEGRMCSCLDDGGMLICSMGPGDFTSTGHFIVIYGYQEDGFTVHDPYSRIRSNRVWDYETLCGQIRAIWAYGV